MNSLNILSNSSIVYEDKGHSLLIGYSDTDWADSRTDRRSTRSTLGYCEFIGGNLILWKSKNQSLDARSSTEIEYRVVALHMWTNMVETTSYKTQSWENYTNDSRYSAIASYPVLHEWTKHIEINFYFIKEKIPSGDVITNLLTQMVN